MFKLLHPSSPKAQRKITEMLGRMVLIQKSVVGKLKKDFCVLSTHGNVREENSSSHIQGWFFLLRNGLDLGKTASRVHEIRVFLRSNSRVFVEDRFGFPLSSVFLKMIIIWEMFNDVKANSQ